MDNQPFTFEFNVKSPNLHVYYGFKNGLMHVFSHNSLEIQKSITLTKSLNVTYNDNHDYKSRFQPQTIICVRSYWLNASQTLPSADFGSGGGKTPHFSPPCRLKSTTFERNVPGRLYLLFLLHFLYYCFFIVFSMFYMVL